MGHCTQNGAKCVTILSMVTHNKAFPEDWCPTTKH